MTDNTGLTYKDAGVDIEAGEDAVDLIQPYVKKTFLNFRGDIISDPRAFAGLVKLPDGKIVGTSTDGAGTKLKLAIALKQHKTIGIDVVAMNVNDLIATGIEDDYLFVDYIATWKQIPAITEDIIFGFAEGCLQCNAALIGGEMAEMPDMYAEDHYDLAGFVVGFADSIDGLFINKHIKKGMWVYGIPSSGAHSNGYSLLRQVHDIDPHDMGKAQETLNVRYDELGETLGEALLRPTKIYYNQMRHMRKHHDICGAAHITGGGLTGNPARILPDDLSMHINLTALQIYASQPILAFTQERGGISDEEMRKTFNCGVGMVFVSPDKMPTDNPWGIFPMGIIRSGDGTVVFD